METRNLWNSTHFVLQNTEHCGGQTDFAASEKLLSLPEQCV